MASFKKFSDIPFYMIKDYFDLLLSIRGKPFKDNWIDLDQFLVFVQPWLEWDDDNKGFLDFNPNHNTSSTYTKNSRVVGPKMNIIVKGSSWTTFYAKIEDYGYKPVKMKPLENEPWIDGNYMKYEKMDFNEYIPGIFKEDEIPSQTILDEHPEYVIEPLNNNQYAVIKRIATSSGEPWEDKIYNDRYNTANFKVYKTKYLKEEITLESGTELYIRNDSFFHDWFRKDLKYLGEKVRGVNAEIDTSLIDSRYNVWNHNTFLNDNVLYSYYGIATKIMFDSNRWNVFHRSLKDFMIEAIPINDHNERLNKWMWETYDRVYQEYYNMNKNIYTLLDPEDIPIEHLGYLPKYYDVDLDKYNLEEDRQREYTKNLIYFLKKKGTYNSIYIVWKTLLNQNFNKLSIYERWHTKNCFAKIVNVVNFNEFEELDSVEYFSFDVSGSGWDQSIWKP